MIVLEREVHGSLKRKDHQRKGKGNQYEAQWHRGIQSTAGVAERKEYTQHRHLVVLGEGLGDFDKRIPENCVIRSVVMLHQ